MDTDPRRPLTFDYAFSIMGVICLWVAVAFEPFPHHGKVFLIGVALMIFGGRREMIAAWRKSSDKPPPHQHLKPRLPR